MARLENERDAEDLHEENSETEAGKLREDMTPPDATEKKEGVTSSFSTATGDPGQYSGEDISDVEGDTGSDEDKVAN